MGSVEWGQLAGAALSGSALPWLAGFAKRRLFKDPRTAAEARKINAEADSLIITRLCAEIERLDRDVNELRRQLADERNECDRRIAQMEGRIRQLQQRQTSAGNMANNQVEGPLRTAFPVIDEPDKDDDLIAKLDRSPRPKRKRP